MLRFDYDILFFKIKHQFLFEFEHRLTDCYFLNGYFLNVDSENDVYLNWEQGKVVPATNRWISGVYSSSFFSTAQIP
jgi:hypothetical protein